MFNGKTLSILGDSISTYRGVSNDKEANVTIQYNPCFYAEPFPLAGTYWMRLMKEFDMTLCVNNSWSGGNLSGMDNPDSGVNRSLHLSKNDGTNPDVIIVFMGINDFGRNVPIDVFAHDYAETLTRIKGNYPNVKVCCVNIPDRYVGTKARTELFNQAIVSAVEVAGEGFFVADLFGSRLNNDFYYMNTLDGLHPDEDGARIIYEVISDSFKNYETLCK